MKTQQLTEMPHLVIHAKCPWCGQYINVEDYRVELWDEPMSFKQYFLKRLVNDKKIPVLCPNPDCPVGNFTLNKKTHKPSKTPQYHISKELIKNKDKVAIDY